MTAEQFFLGLFIGFMVAVPAGPVGVFCIKRFVVNGIVAGLVSGLGIAMADALAASVALLGVTLVENFLASHQQVLRLVAGILLCYIGIATIFRGPADRSSPAEVGAGESLIGSFIKTFVLTFANPVTVASFVAVFVGFGVSKELLDVGDMTLLIGGIFSGSALWWLLWAAGQWLFPANLTFHRLWWFNTLSGLAIAGFGGVLIVIK